MANLRRPRPTQAVIAFWFGIAGLVYEAGIHQGEPRSVLVLAYLVMCGFPATVLADRVVREQRVRDDDRPETKPPGQRDEE